MTGFLDLFGRVRDDEGALLRAVLLDDVCEAGEAWRAWRRMVDFDALDAASQRLLPQIARRLAVLAPNDPIRARIRGIYRFVWARNQSHLRNAAHVARRLSDSGVPVLALKGLALASVYGDDWGARPMFDVDLLVPTERAAVALTVLEAAGWRATFAMSSAAVASRLLVRRHSWNYSHPESGEIDVHWHVFAESLGPRADRAVWTAAIDQRVLDVELRRPCDADLLLHLIEHGAHLEPASTLQWLADAHRLVVSGHPAELADRLSARARAHGLLDSVVAGLGVLDELLGTGVAAPLLAALRATPPRFLDRLEARTVIRATDSAARKTTASWLELLRNQRGATGRPSLSAVGRRVAEPSLLRHPWLAALYLASRRARRVEALLQRLTGPIARPPAPPASVPSGEWLDFADPGVVDSVAGPGWSWTGPTCTWTDSTDARLALPVELLPGHDLVLCLDIDHDELGVSPNRRVEVVVNGRPLVGLDLDHWSRDEGPRAITVPEWLARWCRPLEVSFRTPRAVSLAVLGGNDHRRLGLPVSRLRVDLVPAASEGADRHGGRG